MRSTVALLAILTAVPAGSAQAQTDTILMVDRVPDTSARALAQRYHPIRPGETQSAGFLTEMEPLAAGSLLGPVIPAVVRATQAAQVMQQGNLVAISPPKGAHLQRGDLVIFARTAPGPEGWGDIVIPTGVATVTDPDSSQTLARVTSVFGEIHPGQLALAWHPQGEIGAATPVPVNGPSGTVIAARDARSLRQQGAFVFIDLGRAAGVRVGDFVQFHRRPGPRPVGPDAIADLMASGEIVHVGDRSSTVKLLRVNDPTIAPGTPVKRVGTLPG